MATASPASFPSAWQQRAPRALALTHGLFYFVSGLWPVVHLSSFLALTGEKRDAWLAQTVGALLAVTGLALVLAARRHRLSPEWALLAAGQAAALATVDVVMVARDRIAAIYLLDAVVEIALILAWLIIALRLRASAPAPDVTHRRA